MPSPMLNRQAAAWSEEAPHVEPLRVAAATTIAVEQWSQPAAANHDWTFRECTGQSFDRVVA